MSNAPNSVLKLIVIDDHPLFRNGIIETISQEPDMMIVGEFADGAQGLKAIRQQTPDLAIIDINLPTLNGIEILSVLQGERATTRLVVLTAHHDEEQTLHVIRSGAHAYANKEIKPALLIKMIRVIANGDYVINNKRMSEAQRNQWITQQLDMLSGVNTVDIEKHYIPLSPREMEILKFVTEGMSNQEIALQLNISQQTVKNHMTSILRKLNVQDRTQAAVTAIRRGWVRISK